MCINFLKLFIVLRHSLLTLTVNLIRKFQVR